MTLLAHVQLTHWIGVALTVPASVIVLHASWRSFAQQRAARRAFRTPDRTEPHDR